MSEQERLARVALTRATEPGDPRITRLVTELGARAVHEHIVHEPDTEGLRADYAQRLAEADPDKELSLAETMGVSFVVPGDQLWPTGLDELSFVDVLNERGGPPVGLWVKGLTGLQHLDRGVAVVGSRSSTTYGDHTAAGIAAGVSRAGATVVSGAAYGIDHAAHRGALAEREPTIAVLACGADRVYPAAHRELVGHIARTGSVVSEAPLGGNPLRIRFLARNRIIAAISAGTVVVEAAIRSGALNTAHWSEQLGRQVMGVPGPVTSAPSQGVHQWIRDGVATLVTNAADVLELIGDTGEHLQAPLREMPQPRDRLSVREHQVLEAVPTTNCADTAVVAQLAGVNLLATRSTLDRLHREGFVCYSGAGWRLGARG